MEIINLLIRCRLPKLCEIGFISNGSFLIYSNFNITNFQLNFFEVTNNTEFIIFGLGIQFYGLNVISRNFEINIIK